MKKLIAILIALSSFFVACNQQEVASFSDSDFEELVEADLDMIVSTIEESGLITVNLNVLCGVSNDSSISRSGTPRNGNFEMTASWEWEVLCTNNLPSDLDLESNGSFSYTHSNISASSTIIGDFLLSELVSANDFKLNGSINSDAEVSTRSQRSNRDYSSEALYTYQDVAFDRTTYEIQAGTVQVNVKGDFDNGGTFDRTATLVFNGGNSATLTLDNGAVYTINW